MATGQGCVWSPETVGNGGEEREMRGERRKLSLVKGERGDGDGEGR